MTRRCAVQDGANRRPARHRLHKAWSVEQLEGRTLLSQFSVTNLDDGGGGSLRQAIVDSNNTAGPNEIDFAAGLSGTITLTSGELKIENNAVTILGPGQNSLSVSGNANSRVFEVTSGVTASLSGMTISERQCRQRRRYLQFRDTGSPRLRITEQRRALCVARRRRSHL